MKPWKMTLVSELTLKFSMVLVYGPVWALYVLLDSWRSIDAGADEGRSCLVKACMLANWEIFLL